MKTMDKCGQILLYSSEFFSHILSMLHGINLPVILPKLSITDAFIYLRSDSRHTARNKDTSFPLRFVNMRNFSAPLRNKLPSRLFYADFYGFRWHTTEAYFLHCWSPDPRKRMRGVGCCYLVSAYPVSFEILSSKDATKYISSMRNPYDSTYEENSMGNGRKIKKSWGKKITHSYPGSENLMKAFTNTSDVLKRRYYEILMDGKQINIIREKIT